MKKFLALMLALLMVFTFAACKGGRQESSGNNNGDDQQLTEGNEEELDSDIFKVGVVYVDDPDSGSVYSREHDMGIVQMQQALGLSDSQLVRKFNIDDGDANAVRAAMEECIEDGCNIIFGTGRGYMNTMAALAKEYPDVIFSHAAGNKSNGENFNNYFGRIYQARYLSGIAAGLNTESGLIGYVAAFGAENSEITAGIDAFAMGVESVNPEAKVYVKVTNSQSDPELERQAAEDLLSMGCDVIAQHCGTAAPLLAAGEAEVWGCGYNSDMLEEKPAAQLTAPVCNWGVYYTKATKAVMEDNWTGENYFGGMDEGFVALSSLSKSCAEGTSEAVKAATEEILGGHDVFTDEIIDNNGNVVCEEGGALSDSAITDGINWYYRNVEVV